VLIAVYLVPDLAQRDLRSVPSGVEDKTVVTDSLVLVKGNHGEVTAHQTGEPIRVGCTAASTERSAEEEPRRGV
jgi:hypothetical protein